MKNFNEFGYHTKETLSESTKYTTIRLDDDDGLSNNFLEELNKYEDQTGKIITAPNGTNFTIKDENIIFGRKVFCPNIALGLTAVGFNIYNAGNHMTVSEKFEVIKDTNMEFYLCCSEHCDTHRKFQ